MEIVAETKACKKCGVEKPIGEFRVKVDSKGYSYRCGACPACQREDQKLRLREYRKVKGHKIQARHRQRLLSEAEYRERKREQSRRKYERSREYKKAYQIKYRRDNPQKSRASDWRNWLKKTYGLTIEQYQLMIEAQGNKCLICNDEFAERRKRHVDHCHKTGVVRGLLCQNCNFGIGAFRDRPDLLIAAANYLNPQSERKVV